jgi:hypothetical protein
MNSQRSTVLIYAEAWENLRKRRMTMKLSMTIALVAALCIGQFFSGDLIWDHILTYDIWKLEKFPTPAFVICPRPDPYHRSVFADL